MLNWVQVRTLTGPLKNINFIIIQPLQCGFCFCASDHWPAEMWISYAVSDSWLRQAGFHQKLSCALDHPLFLLSWQACQSLLIKSIPITWCCHHHASQKGWCSLGDVLCWVCAKHNVLHLGQKVPSWFRQNTKRFATWLHNLCGVFCIPQMGLKVGFLE